MAKHAITVLVLAGGDSTERDVSLKSAHGMAGAARELGHRVLVCDPARPEVEPSENFSSIFGDSTIEGTPPAVIEDVFDARATFVHTLANFEQYGIDVVLNGLHGGVGEDGTIQAVLDYVGIPYTGSGAAACALAMDKFRSKKLAEAYGVPVTRGQLFNRRQHAEKTIARTVQQSFSFPAVVKPNTQGSSVGLTVVASFEDLEDAVARAFNLDDDVLVEEYVAGSEITVAVLEGEGALPVLEIRPKSGLYDYFHKYQSGASEYLVPAPLDESVAGAIKESALLVFHALGCEVYGRVDFRLDQHGQHYLLEVNTLPGMTAMSLVPKAAKAAGIGYTELVSGILRLSLDK